MEQTKIQLEGLTPGFTYAIYKAANLNQKLGKFTPSKSTYTLHKLKLNNKSGNFYMIVGKAGYVSSIKTTASYNAQPTFALPRKNVNVTNAKKQDTIKFTGLKKEQNTSSTKIRKRKKVIAFFTSKGKTKTT